MLAGSITIENTVDAERNTEDILNISWQPPRIFVILFMSLLYYYVSIINNVMQSYRVHFYANRIISRLFAKKYDLLKLP